MRAAASKQDPQHKVMLTSRVPWVVLDEALFHAWHQRIESLTTYVVESLRHFNACNAKLDSKLSDREQEATKPRKMRL